ncbi:MAG: response regulator transcription factor [Cellulosilyticaceae bacterium]
MYKVMIIDDEVFIREGLTAIIPWKAFGCEIVGQAEDGEEGVEKIIKLKPDIIISDIRMPKKNGLEMIDEIKSLNQNTQIIILTGYREFEYAQQAIRLGVLRLLLKPSKLDEIKEAIGLAVNNLDKLPKQKEQPQEKNEGEKEKPQYLVKQAVDYITKNYREKIDLQRVADELYVSTWHLCKIIKKQTGKNFIDLLNSARIEGAKKLLIETNLKVYEIAEEVGYADTAYFSRIFKKIAEVTPNEYRNKMYKGKNEQ